MKNKNPEKNVFIIVLFLFFAFFVTGCISEKGLIFLKDSPAVVEISGKVFISEDMENFYPYSFSDICFSYNTLVKNIGTEAEGYFKLSVFPQELATLNLKDTNLEKFIKDFELFINYAESFEIKQDTEELFFTDYTVIISLKENDETFIDIILPPTLLNLKSPVSLGKIEIIKNENEYSYLIRDSKDELYIADFSKSGEYKYLPTFKTDDYKDRNKIEILKNNLTLINNIINDVPFINNVTIDEHENKAVINGFNFSKDTGSVVLNNDFIPEVKYWDNFKIVVNMPLLYENFEELGFQLNISGKLSNIFILTEKKNENLYSDTEEIVYEEKFDTEENAVNDDIEKIGDIIIQDETDKESDEVILADYDMDSENELLSDDLISLESDIKFDLNYSLETDYNGNTAMVYVDSVFNELGYVYFYDGKLEKNIIDKNIVSDRLIHVRKDKNGRLFVLYVKNSDNYTLKLALKGSDDIWQTFDIISSITLFEKYRVYFKTDDSIIISWINQSHENITSLEIVEFNYGENFVNNVYNYTRKYNNYSIYEKEGNLFINVFDWNETENRFKQLEIKNNGEVIVKTEKTLNYEIYRIFSNFVVVFDSENGNRKLKLLEFDNDFEILTSKNISQGLFENSRLIYMDNVPYLRNNTGFYFDLLNNTYIDSLFEEKNLIYLPEQHDYYYFDNNILKYKKGNIR
ncbi:MAG: hypothetical protein WC337_01610 [Candidatus Muiribacteriota bacterium]